MIPNAQPCTSRLFSGSVELKVEHIFQLLGVLGLTPAEYSILEGFGPVTREERPPSGNLSPEELEQLVSSTLRKMLQEAKGEQPWRRSGHPLYARRKCGPNISHVHS